MIRVVFVDDETNVLDGLRRSTREMRDEWVTHFADSGPAALALLEKTPCDVLVTDMRMPGMDGLKLLEAVASRYPTVARVVLTGQCDAVIVTEAANTSHRFLTKPCSFQVLQDAITQAVSLRSLLVSPTLVRLVSGFHSIPVLPPAYHELTRLFEDDRATAADVGRLIAQDMGLCARVLQLANSPLFGSARPIASPAIAVNLLGFNMLKHLTLAVHVFRECRKIKSPVFDVQALWRHSFRVGVYAAALARTLAPGEAALSELAQVAGLLHDVGQLLLVNNLPSEFEATVHLAESHGISLSEAEQITLGTSHADIGAYVLALWGLPEGITRAILAHHQPEIAKESLSLALRFADVLAVEHTAETSGLPCLETDRSALDVPSFKDQLGRFDQLCRELAI